MGHWPVMDGKDTSHDVLVDVDAEGLIDLLCDSSASEPWVALLHCNDGLDEFARWSLGAKLQFAARSIQQLNFRCLSRL
jgi:hypothetical protein